MTWKQAGIIFWLSGAVPPAPDRLRIEERKAPIRIRDGLLSRGLDRNAVLLAPDSTVPTARCPGCRPPAGWEGFQGSSSVRKSSWPRPIASRAAAQGCKPDPGMAFVSAKRESVYRLQSGVYEFTSTQ